MTFGAADVEIARRALGLNHSSSCGQSEFVKPRTACWCGAPAIVDECSDVADGFGNPEVRDAILNLKNW